MDFREVKRGALHPFVHQGTQQDAVAGKAPGGTDAERTNLFFPVV